MRIPFRRQIKFLKTQIYLRKKSLGEKLFCLDQSDFDLITVSFNNEFVVDYQIRLIKKNLEDNHVHTVFDNSPTEEKQKKIEQVCVSHRVNYVKLPANPYCGEVGSASHGVALNWIYRNFISVRQPEFFGFIDHDIFPVEKTSILDKLISVDIFGKIDERGSRWYLWPGFSFFRFNFLKGKKINFMPEPGVDTGGKNWWPLYSKMDKDKLPSLRITLENLHPGCNLQTDMYEKMGDWIHTVNASEWVRAPHKNALISELLEKYLKLSAN